MVTLVEIKDPKPFVEQYSWDTKANACVMNPFTTRRVPTDKKIPKSQSTFLRIIKNKLTTCYRLVGNGTCSIVGKLIENPKFTNYY